MKKFGEFIKKHNILELSFIFLVMLLLFAIFYGKTSKYIIDFSREAYIPWQMTEGKLLYKDLFNVYGPLGYQINALAFKLFGIHLNVLYWLGFLNSVIISFFVYLITKLFTDKKIALCTTGIIITFCVYIVSIHNLLIPYSYNAIYALSSLLISIYAMILYIKDKKQNHIILSFLFAGFSFANKIEYLPYFCMLFALLPFLVKNKKNWKEYLAPASAFFVFPAISFGTLLLQGVSIQDFLNAYDLIKKLIAAPATDYFYKAYGLYFNKYHLFLSIKFFFKILKTVIPICIIFYALNFINYKYIQNRIIKNVFNIFNLFIIFVFAYFVTPQFGTSFYLFCWTGIFILLTIAGIVLKKCLEYKNNKTFNLSLFEKMFLFLCLSSVLVSLKGLANISNECYGTFTTTVLIMPVYIFAVKYIPMISTKINTEIWKKSVINLSVIAIVVLFSLNLRAAIQNSKVVIKTDRGIIFNQNVYSKQDFFINYIKEKTPKDAYIVALPEGALINFLTNRKSHGLYYYLIPGNVQVFGEKNIVEDFKKNPPDYFIVNDITYVCYNTGSVYDYMPELKEFIQKHYKIELYIKGGISFILYKRNK